VAQILIFVDFQTLYKDKITILTSTARVLVSNLTVGMGIPSYFSYIIKNHPAIIINLMKLVHIDNLYIDSNSIIYDAVRKTQKSFDETTEAYERRIYNSACTAIDKYIDTIRPKERVIIAFDGVAPLAKLRQQRERRNRSWFIRNICYGDIPEASSTHWDTTAITPGTQFMRGLNEYVSDYFRRRAASTSTSTSTSTSASTSTPHHWNPHYIMVSGSDVPGEGEHKLFEYIRANSEPHARETTVIYGLDADLIVLALNHLRYSKNLYLAREAPHFARELNDATFGNDKGAAHKHEPEDTLYCLDICELGDELVHTICNTHGDGTLSERIKASKMMDYTLLTFFLGNDFMPHFPTLNIRTTGVDTLLDAYKATYRPDDTICTADGNIQWNKLRRLIDTLAKDEHTNFMREMATRGKMEMALWRREEQEERAILQQARHNREASGGGSAAASAHSTAHSSTHSTAHSTTHSPSSPSSKVGTPEFREERLNRTPLLYRAVETYIDPSTRGWEGRYYEALFQSKPRRDFLSRLCRQYMEGLEWTLGYYSFGCKNLRWKYDFHYAPLFADLAPLIPHFNTRFIKEDYTPLDPIVQLAYVLPKSAVGLLPEDVSARITEKLPDFYTDKFDFQWAFCKYFWEGHPLLPEIEIEELEAVVLRA
jgi:5'-3' exoribonuclease 1